MRGCSVSRLVCSGALLACLGSAHAQAPGQVPPSPQPLPLPPPPTTFQEPQHDRTLLDEPKPPPKPPMSRGGLKYAGLMLGLDVVGWLALGAADSDHIDSRIPGGSAIDVPAIGGIGMIMLAGNGVLVHCLRGACNPYALGYSVTLRVGLPALVAGIAYVGQEDKNTDKINFAGNVARDTGLVMLLAGSMLDYILTLANPDFYAEDKPKTYGTQATWLLSPTRDGGVLAVAGSF